MNKVVVIISILFTTHVYGEIPQKNAPFNNAVMEHVLWDGNNIASWHGNHGDVVSYHVTGNAGLEWPKGSGKTAVFSSGIWLISGKVRPPDQGWHDELRTAAVRYVSEYSPGSLNTDPDLPEYRIYSLRSKSNPSDTDWQEWPTDQGAPWIDMDNDGFYDPAIDKPEIIGDLFHWYVMNDGDPVVHTYLWGTPPMNVEVQVSVFGFDSIDVLENTFFTRWTIINQGQSDLDSVFFAFWSDDDIGYPTDDLIGCSPMDNLGFTYKSGPDSGRIITRYGLRPPVVGHQLLQGPLVDSVGDTAWQSGEQFPDHRNLPMTAFNWGRYPTWWDPSPYTAEIPWNMVHGLTSNGAQLINVVTGNYTTYIYSGDPTTGEGWVNEYISDGSVLICSGPFSLFASDTQEVVTAIQLSQGRDHLASVAALKDEAQWVQSTWNSNFTRLGPLANINEVEIPRNRESTGQFEFIFRIQENLGWVLSDERWLYYSVHKSVDSVEMNAVTWGMEPDYYAVIPEIQNITGTTRLDYWIGIESTDGESMVWPSGAPYNHGSITFGPDTTKPVLTRLSQLQRVHYLLPFERDVTVQIVDDRFPIEAPTLNWTIAGSSTITGSMTRIDSIFRNWEWVGIWTGTLSGQGTSIGDTIRYWVTAVDGSMNQNSASSSSRWFIADDHDVIGDWENSASYAMTEQWKMFSHGKFQKFNLDTLVWDRVLISHLTQSAGHADTLEYLRSLEIPMVEQLWFTIPMAYDFHEEPNHGIIEIYVHDSGWVTLDSLTGYQSPVYRHYSIAEYSGSGKLTLRLRVNRSTGFTEWILDDIILHSDSTRLGSVEPLVTPEQYALHQNYPNPFNPVTTIRYELPKFSHVRLTVYDILGREIAILGNREEGPGVREVQWNASNVPSGIYFVQMTAGDFRQVRKVMMLK